MFLPLRAHFPHLLEKVIPLLFSVVTGAHGHARLRHNRLRHALRAHGVDGVGRGPDERYSGLGAPACERRVFGEESVTGMQRLV